jgi:hypothetical protein
MCLYALRGLGDESTIEQIKQMPLIKKSAYLGAENLAINAIKKRLKAENDSI